MSRVLSADEISKVSQYDFDMKKMTVVPKYVKISNSDSENKEVIVLDSILDPLKVNLSPIQDIREIGLVTSGQARSKIRKSSLKEKLNLSKTSSTSQEDKDTKSTDPEAATDKTLVKNTLVESATAL